MARVAVLTMSDGRDFVALDLIEFCNQAEDTVAAALERSSHQVERGGEPVTTSDVATSAARRVASGHPDLTIFHYPVWAFPHFTMPAWSSPVAAMTRYWLSAATARAVAWRLPRTWGRTGRPRVSSAERAIPSYGTGSPPGPLALPANGPTFQQEEA